MIFLDDTEVIEIRHPVTWYREGHILSKRGSGTCDWAHAMGIWNGLVCQLVLDKFNLKFCVCYFWTSKNSIWLDPGYLKIDFFWKTYFQQIPTPPTNRLAGIPGLVSQHKSTFVVDLWGQNFEISTSARKKSR